MNRKISNNLKYICWILFLIHFCFLVGFHGIKTNNYFNIYNLILDIIILILFQSISLFITLSELHNSFIFYIFSFICSFLDSLVILFSMIISFLCFIGKNNYFNECKRSLGLEFFLFFFKLFELVPLFILIFVFKKIKKEPGSIEMKLENFQIDRNIEYE